MSSSIHVLNASSRKDTGITQELERSLTWLSGPSIPPIRCVTLDDGPNGIANGRDSDRAAAAVIRYVESHADESSVGGFVVACFSDPGVHSAREATIKPVIGVGEAALQSALALGERFGTIGASAGQEGKTRRFVRRTTSLERYAGHVGLGLDYADLQTPDLVEGELLRAARSLREDHGADVIVLASAGLARYVTRLVRDVGLPVVEPTAAAVLLAMQQIARH